MTFTPQQAILSLGRTFYDPVEPAHFPETILRFRNDRAAASVGLEGLSDAEWIAHFGRFAPLPGSLTEPLALRYHGHQFRHYNAEIGDGRGFLFAQMTDESGRLLDLGTKGSGQTPYSRFGDGRLTLKGGVREILATEMLEALGVNTSKTFSLIETGEALHRGDEPSPTRSAVLVRLSHGHIRIGTFQRLAYFEQAEEMRALVDYVLRHLYGEEPGPEPAVQLLDLVVQRTATLAGQYMAAGFVHGVLNSDNINVTGESFDYGPWRFNPTRDPGFTAAYFDETGLYAFGRQPEAIFWDVAQLANCLAIIASPDALTEALNGDPEPPAPTRYGFTGFGTQYQEEMRRAFLWRLGVRIYDDRRDFELIEAVERALARTGTSPNLFFHDWFGGIVPASYGEAFDEVRKLLSPYTARKPRQHPYWAGPPCSMLIDEVEAIWAPIAEHDDWSALNAKVAAIRQMGQALE